MSNLDLRGSLSFICQQGEKGFIVPLSEGLLRDKELLKEIRDWRNNNLRFFFSQSVSTVATTTTYLKQVLNDPAHSFFLLITETGKSAGHLGYIKISDSTYELDNLVRGNFTLPRDFIECAERALLVHLFGECGAQSVILKVFSSNILAKRIHESLGFQIVRQDKFKKIVDKFNDVKFVAIEEDNQEATFVQTLELNRRRFLSFNQ
jgi:hypothetical protein